MKFRKSFTGGSLLKSRLPSFFYQHFSLKIMAILWLVFVWTIKIIVLFVLLIIILIAVETIVNGIRGKKPEYQSDEAMRTSGNATSPKSSSWRPAKEYKLWEQFDVKDEKDLMLWVIHAEIIICGSDLLQLDDCIISFDTFGNIRFYRVVHKYSIGLQTGHTYRVSEYFNFPVSCISSIPIISDGKYKENGILHTPTLNQVLSAHDVSTLGELCLELSKKYLAALESVDFPYKDRCKVLLNSDYESSSLSSNGADIIREQYRTLLKQAVDNQRKGKPSFDITSPVNMYYLQIVTLAALSTNQQRKASDSFAPADIIKVFRMIKELKRVDEIIMCYNTHYISKNSCFAGKNIRNETMPQSYLDKCDIIDRSISYRKVSPAYY